MKPVPVGLDKQTLVSSRSGRTELYESTGVESSRLVLVLLHAYPLLRLELPVAAVVLAANVHIVRQQQLLPKSSGRSPPSAAVLRQVSGG